MRAAPRLELRDERIVFRTHESGELPLRQALRLPQFLQIPPTFATQLQHLLRVQALVMRIHGGLPSCVRSRLHVVLIQ